MKFFFRCSVLHSPMLGAIILPLWARGGCFTHRYIFQGTRPQSCVVIQTCQAMRAVWCPINWTVHDDMVCSLLMAGLIRGKIQSSHPSSSGSTNFHQGVCKRLCLQEESPQKHNMTIEYTSGIYHCMTLTTKLPSVYACFTFIFSKLVLPFPTKQADFSI